jgi:hypothetical protein
MIYCLTRKPEEYGGLFSSYGHDRHLFSLMSRTSTAFFAYEQGFEDVPETAKIAEFVDITPWAQTLESEIEGIPIRTMLEIMTPREVTNLIHKTKPQHLPLCSLFAHGLPTLADALWFNFYIRTLQHEKYFRGEIVSTGKVAFGAFGSRLQPEEDALLNNQTKTLKELMKNV